MYHYVIQLFYFIFPLFPNGITMSGFVPKDENISLRIPSKVLVNLRECASDKNMTMSFLLLKMIDDGLIKYADKSVGN